jgi:hypothetical protein
MENNESKWTTIKVDSMYRLIDPSGAFVASASKLNCDSIASTLNNYQAIKAENTLLKEVNEAQIFTIEKYQKKNEELKELLKENRLIYLRIGDDFTDTKEHDRAEVWYDKVRKIDNLLTL